MEVVIVRDSAEAGRIGAERIAALIAAKPERTIGVATGSSPLGIYGDLAARVQARSLDVSRVEWFALDEYVGLAAGHPESYASVVARTVTEPLGLDPHRVHVPDGRAADVDNECERYDRALSDRGVDLQILGIGRNGHIGFNEPGSSFGSRTRVKSLSAETRADNARFFSSPGDVPTLCITQGLATIMDAGQLLLVALGADKADAIAAAVEGPTTSMVPGSVLQFHRHATVVVDEAAASKLRLTDYYRRASAALLSAP